MRRHGLWSIARSIPQEQTQGHLVKDLIARAFDGSVKALVMQALSTRKSSPKDLDTIKKLLDKLEGDSL
jgi:predicted transcriptional regulator